MLKRQQILVDMWQREYIRRLAKKYDLSYSETVRTLLSEAILSIFFSLESKKRIGITYAELQKLKKEFVKPRTLKERRKEILSKMFFEAQRATERKPKVK